MTVVFWMRWSADRTHFVSKTIRCKGRRRVCFAPDLAARENFFS